MGKACLSLLLLLSTLAPIYLNRLHLNRYPDGAHGLIRTSSSQLLRLTGIEIRNKGATSSRPIDRLFVVDIQNDRYPSFIASTGNSSFSNKLTVIDESAEDRQRQHFDGGAQVLTWQPKILGPHPHNVRFEEVERALENSSRHWNTLPKDNLVADEPVSLCNIR